MWHCIKIPRYQYLDKFFFCVFWKFVFSAAAFPLSHLIPIPLQPCFSLDCSAFQRMLPVISFSCLPVWTSAHTLLHKQQPIGMPAALTCRQTVPWRASISFSKCWEEYQILMLFFMKLSPSRKRNKHFPYRQCIHYLCLLEAPSTDTCLWDKQIVNFVCVFSSLLFSGQWTCWHLSSLPPISSTIILLQLSWMQYLFICSHIRL